MPAPLGPLWTVREVGAAGGRQQGLPRVAGRRHVREQAGEHPVAAAASCAKLGGILTGATALIETLLIKEIGPAMKDLHKAVDGDGFPDGNWPTLTSDIGDSSHKENKGEDAPWDMIKR